ncbi:MAG: hypothetical protein IPJ49_00080 [Candidatus Obscuribacter sp.]|nr:hypothetical protein [Candidatus Obscuribacter sp.]
MANQQTPILKWLMVILCLAGLGSGAVLDVLAKSKAKSKTSGKLAKPPQSFVQGLQEYQNNRFGPAAEKFEQADRSGYCNEMTHYYLALCYHNLNQTQRAIDHYSWVSSYAKSATLKYNAAVGYNAVADTQVIALMLAMAVPLLVFHTGAEAAVRLVAQAVADDKHF